MGNPFSKVEKNKGSKAEKKSTEGFVPEPTADYDKKFKYAKELLHKTLLAPENKALRDRIYNDWKKLPENKNKSLSQEQLIQNLLKAEDHILEIQRNFPKNTSTALQRKSWDKGTKKNETYNNMASTLGFDPMADTEIEDFQGTYRVLIDLADDPEFEEVLKPFSLKPVGVDDQTYGKGNKPVSPIDGWFGNTTVGQAILPKEYPEEKEEKPIVEGEDTPTQADHLQVPQVPQGSPWWL